MDSTGTMRISRELLSEKVTNALRRQIMMGQIPQGTRLVEDELAARLGVSRGPLREALSVLGREGLVANTPGKGTYVKGLTETWVREVIAVRRVLESFAAELAAERITDQQVADLTELVDRMAQAGTEGNFDEYLRAEVNVHAAIWQLSANERLVDVMEYLINPSTILMQLCLEVHEDWPTTVNLHRRLVEGIGSGDGATAGQVMQEHLDSALDTALFALKSLAEMAKPRPDRLA